MSEFAKYKKQLIAFSSLIGIVIVLIIVITINAGRDNKKTVSINNESKDDNIYKTDANCDKLIDGILMTNIDDEGKFHTYSIDNNLQYVFETDNCTVYRDKYGKAVTKSYFNLGDIVKIGYNMDSKTIAYMYENQDTWELNNIKTYKIEKEKSRFEYDSTRYKLSKGYSVISGDKMIDIDDIIMGDTITVKGIDKNVWSIVVNKAHGSITLANTTDFEGGKITIDKDKSYTVEQGLSIDVIEGEHSILFTKDNVKAETTITVERDKIAVIDISQLDVSNNEISYVTFNITPESARLYVDGVLCSNRKEVKMYYGTYSITVESAGYTAYSGKLDVDSVNESLSVKLAVMSQENNSDNENEDEEGSTKDTTNDTLKDSTAVKYYGEKYEIEKYDNTNFVANEAAGFDDANNYFSSDSIQEQIIGYFSEDGKQVIILDSEQYEEAKENFLKHIKNADNLYFAKSHYSYQDMRDLKDELTTKVLTDTDIRDSVCSFSLEYADVGIGEKSAVLVVSIAFDDKAYVKKMTEWYNKEYKSKVHIKVGTKSE